MRFRAAQLAAVAVAIAAGAAAGCRRSPLAAADGGGGGLDAPRDTAAETDAHDIGNTDVLTDLSSADESTDLPATLDAQRADTADTADLRRDAPDGHAADAPDAAADLSTVDAPVDGAAPDRSGADASDVRPEEQPCGPLGFNCTPFACDVARGLCKTTCANNDDCVGRPCVRGTCGPMTDPYCSSNLECSSGFCAQGVCCQTACSAPCQSCAATGSVGTCTPVPYGALDPRGTCPAGNRCDGRGGCLAAACTTDTECGPSHWCTDGHCAPCAATCASNADCASNYCVTRNLCTYCDVRDAGSG